MPKLKISHILVNHKFEAGDLLRKIQEGANFSDLAKKFSQCSSASQGGWLGEVDLSRLDDDFAEAAKGLRSGELSPIVRTRFGYHLIYRHN